MAKSKLRTACILALLVAGSSLSAQHLSSARGTGIGAFSALVNDLSALDWNPAGLALVRDWELSVSNHLWVGPSGGNSGLVFQGAGLSKRFMEQHSVAIRYAPAVSMEFKVPSVFTFPGSEQNVSFDKRILYDERYSLGYAFRSSETVRLGISARFLQEQVLDTEPFILQDTLARIRTVDYSSASWNVDFGLLWEPERQWKLGVVAKNLFQIRESEFPQNIRPFALRTTKTVRAGVGYSPSKPVWLAFDFDTERQAALGFEWDMGENVRLRQGTYFGKSFGPFVQAISTGLGWSSESARFDVSYLFFTRHADRSNVPYDEFVSTGVKDIGYNQYSPSQLTFSLNVVLGQTRESLARIEHVEIMDEVYPSSYYVHAYRPLGKAIVRNVSNTTIQARVGFYAERFMDSPTMTEAFYVGPQSTKEVQFKAVFNDAIKSVSNMILQAGDVFVRAAQATDFDDDKVQTSLIIRGRNDWDGNVLSLRAFITPNDPEILRFTRAVLSTNKDSLAGIPKELERFHSAILLFNQFAGLMVYVNDPEASKDRVQYPSETLSLRGGDCDDMTVYVATMLSSIGMATALVDVVPPSQPQQGHIYLMFDTGIPAAKASLVSSNPKRYVVRKNQTGQETVWVPIETTALSAGFQKAWEQGAKEYYDDVEVGLGVVRGWVRIVDVLPTM